MALIIDLSGMHFGRLRVLRQTNAIGKRIAWDCLCECGKEKIVKGDLLKRGKVKSCGCLKLDGTNQPRSHGMTGTRVYAIWCGMTSRCRLVNRNGSKNYSIKGIKVCERWRDFENFLVDMGEPPSETHSIDRIDSNGNYEPSNCKWATPREQRHNTTMCIDLTIDGHTKPLVMWCEMFGVKYHTAYARLQKGLALELVFSPTSLRKTARI